MLTNTINSGLLEVANQIKTLSEDKLRLKKELQETSRKIADTKLDQVKIKIGYEKTILLNPDYKNEKSRSFALDEKLSVDDEYCTNENQLHIWSLALEVKNYELEEVRIDLEYQRNILKIAEIELREVA